MTVMNERTGEPAKPEDEIAITTTYGELAKIYWAMGKYTGGMGGDSKTLWSIAKKIFDPDQSLYWSNYPPNDYRYNLYREGWEDLLFNNNERNTEIQELEQQLEEISLKLNKLKRGDLV